MPRPANYTKWSGAPYFIGLCGREDDPIPVVPPPGYAPGDAMIFTARTKAAMKALPDWEILVLILRAPMLVFADRDRAWFRKQWERHVALTYAARKAAADGDHHAYKRLVHAVRFRWRILVQRSVGRRLMGGQVVRWP